MYEETKLEETQELQEVSEQQEEKENKKKKWLLLLLLLLILSMVCCCGIGGYGYSKGWFNKKEAPKEENKAPVYNTEVDDSADNEATKKEEQEKLEPTMMNMTFSGNPQYANGVLYINMENKKVNNDPQIYELYLQEEGKEDVLLYQSKLIPVGKFLNQAEVQLDLGAGDYTCLAKIRGINAETGALVGSSGAKVKLTVH